MTKPQPNGDALYDQVHRLVTDVLQSCSGGAADRLSAFLTEGGDEAERCYTAYMHETHALRSAGSEASQLLPSPTFRPRQVVGRLRSSWANRFYVASAASAAIAASIAVVASVGGLGKPIGETFGRTGQSGVIGADSASIATLVRTSRVVWGTGETPLPDLSRLMPGEHICIDSGRVEILFDTGVELVVTGRADAVIESGMRVVGKLGKFSARVSERGRGFTLETPAMDVIDLGTEFGVEIDATGGTKVAVFQGEVDLQYDRSQSALPAGNASGQERLRVGEAVQIDAAGGRRRLVSVASDDFPTHGFDRNAHDLSPVLFSAVRDNLRSATSKKFYRVVHGGLFDDSRAYVDRNHEWNGLDSSGLPESLRGADYVMPFNDDKFATDFELTLEMAGPCTLYVFFNNNMTTPDWLVANFDDTGIDLGLDEAYGRYSGDASLATGGGMSIDDTFSVWARAIQSAGEVRLGGVDKPANEDDGWSMYGIAATPTTATVAGR